MVTPVASVRSNVTKAILRIEQPTNLQQPSEIPICFNPTEYQIQKQNNFADINIPGLETPPIQFIRGSGEKLTTEFLVDTSDTLEDVRTKYVKGLRELLNIQKELHAPPIVQFVWDQDVFRGVLESLNVTYVMFRPDGVPIRAKLSVSLKQYRTVKEQIKDRPKLSPDFDKAYTVVRGDSLSRIAHLVFHDASKWREIAKANDIRDPRRLQPGMTLVIPKIV